MAKQRDVSNEQILYLLITLREEEAKNDRYTDIIVNKEECKAIGLFNYKIKETGENRLSRLFVISEIQNGEPVSIIYDEKGRFIGWQNQENREKNDIEVARDIELNKQQLMSHLIRGEAKTRIESEGTSSSDTAKAGEGRDLANKEHEEEKGDKNKEEEVEGKKNGQKDTLHNFKNEINIDYKTKIRLEEIINGYYLWEILQIEDKLKGRLPEGLSEKSFRSGYLTTLDSKELEAIDGKERKAEKVMAICTRDGNVIELDDTILELEEKMPREDQKRAEQSALKYRDGKEAEKPQSELDITKEVSYKIPDASSKFGVAEDWGLQVDINREWKKYGETIVAGNKEEISFWQEPKNQDITDKQLQRNRLVTKLEAINEPVQSKEEIEQQEDLQEKDSNETINRRAEHTNELVEECFKTHKNLR